MVRCPTCGFRLASEGPVCPEHGAPPPAPPPAADAVAPFEVPAPVLDGFRVDKLLGQGGFGAVFRATRVGDGVPVAIKVARADQPSASDRLVIEAEALLALGPPAVPIVYDRGRLSDGAAYLVMEYVRGTTLADELAAKPGPVTEQRFALLGPFLCSLVGLAHQNGFVHCDLKPENVFVAEHPDQEGFVVKLFDFGLVRQIGTGTNEATHEEAPEGTPDYMAPEQCEGEGEIDARADVYALGVMLYELVAGAPPFWGNPAEVQQSHRSRRPSSPSRRAAVPLAVEEVIMRCLAKDRERRYPDAGQVGIALAAALGAASLLEKTPNRTPSEAPASAPAPQAAKPKPAAAARERRPVALVFIESKSPAAAIREAISAVGGTLVHTAGVQYAVAFGHEVGDNPTRAAALAAQAFLDRGLGTRALVDLATVSIQVRPDGTRRYQSPLFAKKEQYAAESEPAGVILNKAAVEVLPDMPGGPVASRPGAVLLRRGEDAPELTSARNDLPPLVGRDEDVKSVLDAVRRATTSTGPVPTITTIVGEPGYGKSHLASVLTQHLQSMLPPVHVLVLRAKEVLGGMGDQTARDLFRRVLDLPQAAPADLGRAHLASRIGAELARETWAGVAVTMGWAGTDHPDLRGLAAAPGALRAAAARAAGEGLRLLARGRPLAIVLEDAHFADETTLDALEYATLEETGLPIWLGVFGRPSFGRGRTGWSMRAAARQRIELTALSPVAGAELARRLLRPAERVPTVALDKLVERTQGIPFLLVELVRGLKRDGLVRQSEKTGRWFLATDELDRLPDLPLVQWLASREIESLPVDLAAHARLASTLGAEFSVDELEGITQVLEREGIATDTQLDAGIGVSRLIESGLLVRHRQDRVGFRHPLLRDTLYQTVAPGQLEGIHRAAYRYYEARTEDPDLERLPHMALHAARSGQAAEAARLYLDLAHRADQRHAYLDAEFLYRSALENLGDDKAPAPVAPATAVASPAAGGDGVAPAQFEGIVSGHRGLGIVRLRLGRHEDALKALAKARELAHQHGFTAREADIMLDEATVLDWVHDWARSAQVSADAAVLARAGEGGVAPLTEARLLFAAGRTLHRQDKAAEACELFEKSAALAETLGPEGYETRVLALGLAGWEYAIIRRFAEGEALFESLIKLCETRSDQLNLIMSLQNRCLLSLLSKRTERLLEDFKRIIVITREIGFPLVECLTTRDMGEIQYMLGQVDEAERTVRRAIKIGQQVYGERARATLSGQLLLARILIYGGHVSAARTVMETIFQAQEAARAEGQTEGEFPPSEELLVEMTMLVLKGAGDDDWNALLERARAMTLQPQDVVELSEMRGLAALRAGRREDASRFLAEAVTMAERDVEMMLGRLRALQASARGEAAVPGAATA